MQSPFRRNPPPARLAAAGSPITQPSVPHPSRPSSIQARTKDWQRRILRFAESVPEVAGAASLVRCSISRVKWQVEGANEDLRSRVQARIDQIDFDRMAELIWLSGETFLAVPPDSLAADPYDTPAPYSLSVAELNAIAEPSTVLGPNNEALPLTDPFMRIWKPSRSNRWQATSPNQACLDLIESMYLHQLADTSIATSRLAGAGIVFWPTTAPSIPVQAGEPPEPGSREAMLAEFNDASWQSITQRTSREATIPFVVFYDPTTDAEFKPEMFRIDRDDMAEEYQMRFETYRQRYATAIELPIESTTGMGSTNHWSAWQIDVDKWKTYFAPLVELIRSEVERRFVKQYDKRLTLVVDESALIAKPDATPTLMQLAQLEMIDPTYLFEQLQLDPTKSRTPPPRDYKSNTVSNPPSDFKVGGERGGGRYREQP